MPPDASADSERQRGGLLSRSFLGLLGTQFLGAWNDNMFRWLVVPIAKEIVTSGGGDSESTADALALSVGLACFVLPFLIFASAAGWLADRFSKRNVIIACKAAEVGIMALGVLALWVGDLYVLFVVIFMMGTQSALFGPSKFGCLPEMLRSDRLSAANGLVGLSTVIAVVGGTIAGNLIFEIPEGAPFSRLAVAATALVGTAGFGLATSLLIAPLPVANPTRRFPVNFVAQTGRDLRLLTVHRPLLRVALGVTFFWGLASLAQLNVDVLMIEQLGKTQKDVGVALAILAAGVGLGSVLGGFLSGGRVELGLVPLGAAAIAAGAMLLFAVPQAYPAWLLLLGTGGGIFDVPLAAFMQHRSPSQSRGAILAASNFLTFSAMLLVAGLFYLLHGVWQLGADTIFLLGGIGTLPVLVYSWALLPWATARLVVWIASHTVYRVRVYGREHLPEQGPALLVANHVSWADGIFLMMSSSRPLRVIADASQFRAWPLRVLARMAGVIPISGGPKAIARALDTAHAALAHGELVCVFAEGQMTRTGQLQAFRRGLVEIIQGTGAPIVPVYLDELWGSLWSRRGGQFFWKWPRQWPYPVTIVFGRPCASTDDPRQIRDAVALLGTEAARLRRGRTLVLPRRMLRCMRRMRPRIKITDSTGQSQSGRQFLFRTLVLMRVLRRRTSEDDPAPMIGLLVPPSAAGATANAAAALLRRVAVNLNPMLPEGELDACIAKCRIRHVVTSRRYLDLTGIKPAAEIVALEDVRSQATATDVVVALLGAYVLPVFLLERLLRLTRIRPDDLMAVFFTSGTTGQPKGVMLSHDNVGSNATALEQILDLTPRDVILGVLPWYHSFGYTATLWTTLAMRPTGAFHHTALDARRIGKLCERTKATLLIAPPSFLRAYLRRCTPEQFASLETIITGAEWMSVELAEAFRETFGVEIQASYGATELSPVVSCNVPDVRMRGGVEIGSKAGTVGRPIPNVAVKVVDIDTGEPVGRGAPGRLLVAGPGVMLGYLDEPEETARKIHDRWYDTGDVATIDDDGFLTITGRLSRFSKIGGEMVPHVAIEAAIEHMLGPGQGHRAVVTALPDGRKGERLIVVHADLGRTPRQVCAGLAAAGLPKLWLPTPESFLPVDRIPLLGSGKIALAEVERIVRERFGAS